MTHSYKEILQKSKQIKENVEKEYKIEVSCKWSYYIAKTLISSALKISKIEFKEAPSPKGTHISTQIPKNDYIELARDLIRFVESHKRLPNHLIYNDYKIRTRVYTDMFARILVYKDKNNKLPSQVNANSKAFIKPTETTNKVYDYFVRVFGAFNNTIDGALSKVEDSGYGGYNNDKFSNKETIDAMKGNGKVKPNCTDSCHVFYNIMLALIKMGKYKKVELLHVNCTNGGHVKLRITKNDGSVFIRDPAAVISKNGKGLTANWCTNTPKAINPSWFMANLNR